MEPAAKNTDQPRLCYQFDAIPEDAETQEELNRRMRKPGESGYCPPANATDLSQHKINAVKPDESAAS